MGRRDIGRRNISTSLCAALERMPVFDVRTFPTIITTFMDEDLKEIKSLLTAGFVETRTLRFMHNGRA
jgi:hypothetical protein